MDTIFISALEIETIIGIYDWERTTKQVVRIDIEMATDIKKAAATDSIDDTLNYKAVAKRLIDFVSKSEFLLVEALAENVASVVIDEFNVPWLRLRVTKPGAVSDSKSVGVSIERSAKH